MYDEPLPFLSGLVQRCQRCGGGGPADGPCVRFSGPFQAGGILYLGGGLFWRERRSYGAWRVFPAASTRLTRARA